MSGQARSGRLWVIQLGQEPTGASSSNDLDLLESFPFLSLSLFFKERGREGEREGEKQ